MGRTITHERPRTTSPSIPQAGARGRTFLPKLGISVGALCSAAVAVLLLVAPDLLWFLPMWLGWTAAMGAVVAAYIAGHRLQRSVTQSRRMRRWIADHRTA